MALTRIDFSLFKQLRERGLLPLGGDMLELGWSNWFSDVPNSELRAAVEQFARDDERDDLVEMLDQVIASNQPDAMFHIARVFWFALLQPTSITAIDLHAPEPALRLNLNGPVNLGRHFDYVFNLGTAEHVFDVAQLFKTVHNHTKPGGYMIHAMPFTGWIDHGFYSFNPTFYWDVAAQNNYGVPLMLHAELEPLKMTTIASREHALSLAQSGAFEGSSLLYSIFQKAPTESAFTAPMQGYYAGTLSKSANDSWQTLRF